MDDVAPSPVPHPDLVKRMYSTRCRDLCRAKAIVMKVRTLQGAVSCGAVVGRIVYAGPLTAAQIFYFSGLDIE